MTEYHLTQAGKELESVIYALLTWGAAWAFGDPSPEQLDPLLMMWWMHDHVRLDQLPEARILIQFDFYGAKRDTYWLMLTAQEATICMTAPGYEINLMVQADLATFFKLWLGRISYPEAITSQGVKVDGMPRLVRAFPKWFKWSPAAPAVRAAVVRV